MPHPSPARAPLALIAAVAAIALLTGAALTITGANIRNGTVTSADIKNSSLTGTDVKNSSLTGADIKNGSIGAADLAPGVSVGGPVGATGATGAAGVPGATGAVGVAGSAKAWGAFANPLTTSGAPTGAAPALAGQSSSNVASVSTSLLVAPGVYCLSVDGLTPENATIIANVDASTSDEDIVGTAVVVTGGSGTCTADQFRIAVTYYQREEITVSGSTMNVMLEPVEATDVGVVFAIY